MLYGMFKLNEIIKHNLNKKNKKSFIMDFEIKSKRQFIYT